MVQNSRSAIAESVDHWSGAELMEMIDLTPRTVEVSVMVKRLESAQRLLPTAGNELRHLHRAQEAVLEDALNNLSVARGKLEGKCGRGTLKSGTAKKCHHLILSGEELIA